MSKPPQIDTATGIKSRVMAIDVLRGIDMFFIVGVEEIIEALSRMFPMSPTLNDRLQHAPWAGFHFYDLIFPLFAFIMGTSLVFSLGGFINSVFARTFDDISIVPTFVLTPLTYLGGVFYSIHLLSPFWQALSMANPILHMVNAFRYGILGVSDIPIATALIIMAVFTVALYSLSYWLLVRGTGMRQ